MDGAVVLGGGALRDEEHRDEEHRDGGDGECDAAESVHEGTFRRRTPELPLPSVPRASGMFPARRRRSGDHVDDQRATREPSTGLLTRMQRWQAITSAGLVVVAIALIALLVAHNGRYSPQGARERGGGTHRPLDPRGHARPAEQPTPTPSRATSASSRPTSPGGPHSTASGPPAPHRRRRRDPAAPRPPARPGGVDRAVRPRHAGPRPGGRRRRRRGAAADRGRGALRPAPEAYGELLDAVSAEREQALDDQSTAVSRTTALAVLVALLTSALSL